MFPSFTSSVLDRSLLSSNISILENHLPKLHNVDSTSSAVYNVNGTEIGTHFIVQMPEDAEQVQNYTNFCRICLEASTAEVLISPCKCSGSLAQIHRSCLERWLSASNSYKCEICQFPYNTTSMPPKYQDFLFDSENGQYRRNVLADIVCFLLISPLTLLSIFICVVGSKKFWIESKSLGEALCLFAFSLTLLKIFIIWFIITFKYHSNSWRTWKACHNQVQIVV